MHVWKRLSQQEKKPVKLQKYLPNHQDKTKFHMWKKVIIERPLVFGGIEKKTLYGKANIKIFI